MDAGFKNMAEFEKFRIDRGLPAIGSSDGRRTLDFLNKMVPEGQQYRTFADTPEFTKTEIRQTKQEFKTPEGKNPTVQQRKEVGQRLVAKAKEIGDDADVFFGEKMSSKKMEFIKDQIKRARLLIDDAAKFGFRSFLPILAAGGIPGFIVSAFSEVATAKPAGEGSDLGMGDVESLREQVLQNMDFSRPSESSKLLNELQQSVKNMSNGGIATINNMTRPVGFSNGGETGFLTGPPPGMEFKPTTTMEYRDFNQNGKEDRSEGLYLPRDFQPIKEDNTPDFVKRARKEFNKGFFRMPELSEEQKKRFEMQRLIREKQRQERGLPKFMQLLGSN